MVGQAKVSQKSDRQQEAATCLHGKMFTCHILDSYDFIIFVYVQAVISPASQAVNSKKKS